MSRQTQRIFGPSRGAAGRGMEHDHHSKRSLPPGQGKAQPEMRSSNKETQTTSGCDMTGNQTPAAQSLDLETYRKLLEEQLSINEKMKTFFENGTREVEEVERLKKEKARLEDEHTKLKGEHIRLKERMSEMASRQLAENNPCVEHLGDPLSPTALKKDWDDFFRGGHYWQLYEILSKFKNSDEEVAACTLYNLCKEIYRICTVYVDTVMFDAAKYLAAHLTWVMSGQTAQQGLKEPSRDDVEKLRKAVVPFLTSVQFPCDLGQQFSEVLGQLPLGKPSESFVRIFAEICYHILGLEIPLAVDFSHGPGSPFDAKLFNADDPQQPPPGAVISYILRPPLLRQAGGLLLSKGEAVLQSAPQASRSQPKPTVHTQDAVHITAQRQAAEPSQRPEPPFSPGGSAPGPQSRPRNK